MVVKVQTLALEIITPSNECTGRLSMVSTRHKHNRCEKSPGSATITIYSPSQEEEETDKTKQVQIEQTYEKH